MRWEEKKKGIIIRWVSQDQSVRVLCLRIGSRDSGREWVLPRNGLLMMSWSDVMRMTWNERKGDLFWSPIHSPADYVDVRIARTLTKLLSWILQRFSERLHFLLLLFSFRIKSRKNPFFLPDHHLFLLLVNFLSSKTDFNKSRNATGCHWLEREKTERGMKIAQFQSPPGSKFLRNQKTLLLSDGTFWSRDDDQLNWFWHNNFHFQFLMM